MPRTDPRDVRKPAGGQPLERDRNGHRILKHGLSGYARGCRCDVCTARGTENMAITHGRNGYKQGCRCEVCTAAYRRVQPVTVEKHGYDGYQAGCRCGTCTSANARRMAAEEVRKGKSAGLSAREVAAILEHARRTDPRASLSGWLREAALEKLERETGYVDDVRRAAPKSTNRQPRARAGKQQPPQNVTPS